MRLQCPNCDAEYEVDASAIPYEGRDVQCSNCGHGWFQSHPDFEPDYDVESSLYDPPPPLPQGGDVAGGTIPKRALDPDAMRIVREEVAREEAMRAAEQSEAQKDFAQQGTAPPSDMDNVSAFSADRGLEAELDALATAADAPHGGLIPQNDAESSEITLAGAYEADTLLADPNVSDDTYADEAQADKAQAGSQDIDRGNVEAELDASHQEPVSRRAASGRVARLKGTDAQAGVQSAPDPAAQITTLGDAFSDDAFSDDAFNDDDFSADEDSGLNAQGQDAPSKTGRRAGFYTALIGALLAVAGYVFGPALAAAVPLLAGPVEGFIRAVNALRDQVQVFVPQVSGFIAGAAQTVRDWVSALGWL